MIVEKLIRDQFYVLQVGQKLEQRIAWDWHENFIAGIAEQAENEGVGLAGAGGEQDAIRRDLGGQGMVILGDGLARTEQTLGLGLIAEGLGRGKRFQDGGRIVGQVNAGGVGGGEVERDSAFGAETLAGFGVAIGGELPVGALGKHEVRVNPKGLSAGGGFCKERKGAANDPRLEMDLTLGFARTAMPGEAAASCYSPNGLPVRTHRQSEAMQSPHVTCQ